MKQVIRALVVRTMDHEGKMYAYLDLACPAMRGKHWRDKAETLVRVTVEKLAPTRRKKQRGA